MNSRKENWLLYSSFLLLLAQSVLTSVLFSQTSPDGGIWPILLVISVALNIFYSTFSLWLVQIELSTPCYTAVATIGLTLCIFVLNNYGWIFGGDAFVMLQRIGVARLLSGNSTFYSLYIIFVVSPLLVRLLVRSGDARH